MSIIHQTSVAHKTNRTTETAILSRDEGAHPAVVVEAMVATRVAVTSATT